MTVVVYSASAASVPTYSQTCRKKLWTLQYVIGIQNENMYLKFMAMVKIWIMYANKVRQYRALGFSVCLS